MLCMYAFTASLHQLHVFTHCIIAHCACMHSLHHCIVCMYIYMLPCAYDHSSYSYIPLRAYTPSPHCMFPDSFLLSNTYSIVLFVKCLLISLHYRYIASLCANLSPFTPLPLSPYHPMLESPLASIQPSPAMCLLASPCDSFDPIARHSPRTRGLLMHPLNRTYVRPRSGGSNWSIAIRRID